MSDDNARLLSQEDNSMLMVMKYDLNKYNGRLFSPKQYVIGSSGVHYVYEGKTEKDTTTFGFRMLKDFEFSYSNVQLDLIKCKNS